ncbi:MAG: XRE family transcriptional regulator, partial [Methanosarcina sp.]
LAKLIKCKQSDISRLERENYNKFSLYTLKKIINALGSKMEIRIINEKGNPLSGESFFLKNDTDNALKTALGKYQHLPDSKESNVTDENEKPTPLRA